MADLEKSSNKKNRKRRGKKTGTEHTENNFVQVSHGVNSGKSQTVNPIEDLRAKLADAKIVKDHDLADKLRRQIWIAQDLSAGIEPDVCPDDKETLALMNEVMEYGLAKSVPTTTRTERTTLTIVGTDADARRLKSLNKKLTQIMKLKEKQKNGEKLESNQLEKIKSEAELREEIKHVEELMNASLQR